MIKTYQNKQAETPDFVSFDEVLAVDLESVDSVLHVPGERSSTVYLRGGKIFHLYGAAAVEVLADFQSKGSRTTDETR